MLKNIGVVHHNEGESTNCLLNAFVNQLYEKAYGYNPYVWEIANMVREGVMTREDGYNKIYTARASGILKVAQERLNL